MKHRAGKPKPQALHPKVLVAPAQISQVFGRRSLRAPSAHGGLRAQGIELNESGSGFGSEVCQIHIREL